MEEYQIIYSVKGSLCKDFTGQITYTVCLEQTWKELDVEFSFDADKQHFQPSDVTEELKTKLKEYCEREYGLTADSEEELEDAIYGQMKTELHTLITLNDQFVGNVHRQLTTRHMHIAADDATPGCIPQPVIEGVLKVTILAFTVLLDDTGYTLTVRAR